MAKARLPLRIAPSPFKEDGAGYNRRPRCHHCGTPIPLTACEWVHLPTDPPGLIRPVHLRCSREYEMFAAALDL